jgi:lipopolysaccharide/colanic/teichoic acid biosynthesis glycosyltransferase
MISAIFWLTSAAIVHHHFTYPLSLSLVPARQARPNDADILPSVTVIIPAYQEANVIANKVNNLAAVSYPASLLNIEIHCDGCTDGTEIMAASAIESLSGEHQIKVVTHHENRGKIAVLNSAIAGTASDVIVLTDASATFAPDAITKLVRHFASNDIAAVGGVYDCEKNGSDGEKSYWRFQNRVRLAEAALDSALGLSGALYAFRRSLFVPLEPDTINDDFILPMRMAVGGKRAILDSDVLVSETERTAPGQEFDRRIRIGAGNFQQMSRLRGLANPLRPGLAYCFISGKAMRASMPLLMGSAYCMNVFLADGSAFYTGTLATQLALYLCAIITLLVPVERRHTPFAQLATLVSGHAASALGIVNYARGRYSSKWKRAAGAEESRELYGSATVRIAKRISDIILGLVLFAVFALLLIPIAIAIKLDSKGPIFYRQLRVGKQLSNRTDLFYLIKFRTMRTDAEAKGASWATKKDPRITRIGNFMRKTRLDELPQAINVLRGEMAMIGPRPERPQFFAKLEGNIPLYIERTFGILPGITGLAQVRQGYDETVEDVRNKVGWDHAYAARIDNFWSWLKTDFSIAWETIVVMVRGRGQ